MKTLRRRLWAVLPLGALLAGCHSTPPAVAGATAGEAYVVFVRDMMVESARLKAQSGESSGHAEAAVQAVDAWRGAAQDGDAE